MKKGIRLICSVCLLLLYLLTVASLAMPKEDGASIGMSVHIAAGTLLLAGSLIHLVDHLDWLAVIFAQPGKRLNRKLRHKRRSAFWLTVCTVICTISGVPIQVLSAAPDIITRIHSVSGMILIILMGMHIFRNFGWFSASLRGDIRTRQDVALPAVYNKSTKET